MSRYRHIAAFLSGRAWAITPEKLAEIRATFELLATRNVPEDPARLRAYQEESERRRRDTPRVGGVGVLPLYGILCPKANMVTEYSGGTSLQAWTQDFRAFLADDAVASIIMDIDSPGGMTYGVQELWTEIMAARTVKRVVAVVNPVCASAAYWLATAASEVVISPSGQAGSIGCYAIHEDMSKHEEMEGFKTTIVSAGQYKTEGSPFEPLSEEARTYIQTLVDTEYGTFVKAVAKGRGRSTSEVEKSFGQGRMMMSAAAKAAGLVDRIGTLDETIARLAGKKAGGSAGRAAALVFVPGVEAVDLGEVVLDSEEPATAPQEEPAAPETMPEPPPAEPQPETPVEPVQAGLSLEDRRRRLELARRAG